MTEKDLINQLHTLKQIKPSQNWVVSLKDKILINPIQPNRDRIPVGLKTGRFGKGFGLIFGHKLAFASVGAFAVLIGVFVLSQNALPGDVLYSVKRLTEDGRTLFAQNQEQLVFEVANRRLDEVAKAIENNSARNLAPAISEYKASASQAAKSLVQATKNKQISKEMVAQVKNLEEKKQRIESLGAQIGDNDLENAMSQLVALVANEIKDLETRTLTDTQAQILTQIKADFEAGNYSQALEGILSLNAVEK
jgi:hypothetical protein